MQTETCCLVCLVFNQRGDTGDGEEATLRCLLFGSLVLLFSTGVLCFSNSKILICTSLSRKYLVLGGTLVSILV